MAEPHSNNLPRDTKEIRLYRLLRLQNNIDAVAVELGIAGPLLLWGQGSYTRYSGANTDAEVEAGEAKDATIIVRDKFATALDYYQQAKEIIDALLQQYKPDEYLMASYGVGKRTPQTYLALTESIDAFEKTHNRLVAALDERVVAQAIVDQMVAYRDDFAAELENAGIEDKEKDLAFQLLHSYFDEDTIKLRLIFKIACMVWGDDDPRLKDLGFVPSSEVWTPGQPEPGEPEPPDSWEDEVAGFKVSESPFGLAFIQGVLHPDADGVAIFMAEGPLGVDSQPLMPPEPHEPEVPSLPYSMDVPKNVRVWIWICHVKDGVHGAIAGPEWVEIME